MFESLLEFFKLSIGWEEYFYHNSFIFFVSFFFTILFLQSGLDKILNFDGNLMYFKDHFKNTFLKNQVKLLLIFVTLLEILSGLLSALSFVNNLNVSLNFISQLHSFYTIASTCSFDYHLLIFRSKDGSRLRRCS